MRHSITHICLSLVWTVSWLLGLLLPLVLHAQVPIEEPFVCGGAHDTHQPPAYKQANGLRERIEP